MCAHLQMLAQYQSAVTKTTCLSTLSN